MSYLSIEAKEAIVLKAVNRGSKSLVEIARANNVGLSTLQRWLQRFRRGEPLGAKSVTAASQGNLSKEERFTHLLATHGLDDIALGKYCREQGLYSHQLVQWRHAFLNAKVDETSQQNKTRLNALTAENKRLKTDLNYKEKALAEASALLILKKKADLIWGGNAAA